MDRPDQDFSEVTNKKAPSTRREATKALKAAVAAQNAKIAKLKANIAALKADAKSVPLENDHPFRKWRIKQGLTVAEVAAKLMSTRQAVFRYEAGRPPRQPFLDRIVVITDGAVTASDWLGKEAADVVAKRQASA